MKECRTFLYINKNKYMYNYVYKLEHVETGEFYIGLRSSKNTQHIKKFLKNLNQKNDEQ